MLGHVSSFRQEMLDGKFKLIYNFRPKKKGTIYIADVNASVKKNIGY